VFRDYYKLFCCRCKLPIFCWHKGSVTHFFRAWSNTTHFQNELKETLVIIIIIIIINIIIIVDLYSAYFFISGLFTALQRRPYARTS